MLPACRTEGDEFAIPTFDLTPSDVAGFIDELQEFQSLFHDCFPRRESRAHFFDPTLTGVYRIPAEYVANPLISNEKAELGL